tara:strand:+ start:226 stop:654 length:429 start_codon:yes stop_codon:yes gene_type:complete
MTLQSGFPINRLAELRIDYPSLKVIREHVSNGHARMLVVSLPESRGRTTHGEYKIAIDANDLGQVPVSYILNIEDVRQFRYIVRGGQKAHTYDHSLATIPGTDKEAWWVCHGNFSAVYSVLEDDPVARMGAFLNHIISLLNW